MVWFSCYTTNGLTFEKKQEDFFLIYFTVVIFDRLRLLQSIMQCIESSMNLAAYSGVCVSFCAPCLAFARPALQQGQRGSSSGRHEMKSQSQTDLEGVHDSRRAAPILLPENNFHMKYELITTATGQIRV